MTLLLREIGRFLAGTGLWIMALGVVATAVALPILWVATRRIDRNGLGLAALGAAALAALAHRIDPITGWSPDVGGRPLPVLWAVAGAAATAITLVLVRRERART